MDDGWVGEAVEEIGVEAGVSAGGDDIAKVADDVVKATAEDEIPMEETQTEMEPKVDPEPGSDINIVATDIEAFKDDEMDPDESGGSDTGANVDDASEPEADDYMEVQTKTKGSEDGSLPDVTDSKQLGGLSSLVTNEDEEDAPTAEEENQTVDTEMETETELELGKDIRGKRKRGKDSKVLSTRAPSRKTVGEDVCFICFDGGDLVLCDRRGCPKAYHPSCVNRDEAFFRAKGKWNCGWHLCSICEKNAYYMCYTCTFSLCKGCIKDAVILRVRANKGFCETCMKTVMLIENNEPGYAEAQIDFDDKNNWEYLFKDYYMELKTKLSLSSVELAQARNPWKGSDAMPNKQESPDEHFYANDDGGSGSDNSFEKKEISKPKRRKTKKRVRSLIKGKNLTVGTVSVVSAGTSTPGNAEWASKELLEFVMHMRNGDKSVLSQFDVQALLLDYIKQNKLRDPRRKSQIICDSRLENLFGKARVGHFEMLKLLESHFLIKEDSQTDDIQGTVVDTEVNQIDADVDMDALNKGFKEKKRKNRKKGDGRGPQSNLDDYAAINMHNINLLYLPRKLMEDLLEDHEKFHDKVVGTFVRIRISGSSLKQDIYRLVQVVGTSKATETYKVGKRTTDVMLEILNLNKTEVISIDTISNQEFTEDECKRLRQSIKCGLINRLTVGDVLDKAMEVHAARVNDWLEKETVRLSHLCDRASDMGHRKELRECVEKLQLLKKPEERRRRLEEVPEIHADPKMDPSYESEEDENDMDGNKHGIYTRSGGSDFSRRVREPISPGKGDFSSKDSWSGTRNYSIKNLELTRSLSNRTLSNKDEETPLMGEGMSETSWNHGENDIRRSNNLETLRPATVPEPMGWNSYSTLKSETFSVVSETPPSLSPGVAETAAKMNETEKVWHYKDPSGKVQGPFSMVQLRKWNKTGYFPAVLRIWRTTEMEGDSVLLTDALAGRLKKDMPSGSRLLRDTTLHSPRFSSTQIGVPSVEVPKLLTDSRSSDYTGGIDSSNLPSPTPKQSAAGWSGGEGGQIVGNSSFPVGGCAMQSPLASLNNGQFSHSTSSVDAGGGKEPNAVPPGSVVNSVGQITRVSGNGPSILQSGFVTANNTEQFVSKGPTNAVQTSHPTDGAHMLQSHSHQITSSDTPPQTAVQPVSNQNPPVETREWGHKVESNSSMSFPGQMQALGYSQWTGVPSAGHNSSENFSNPSGPALLHVSPWDPQIPGNQSNMQPSAQANVQWGMGVMDSSSSAPSSRPENISTGWGCMQGNPNVGWGGPAPGNLNINWAAVAQGQGLSPVNLNPSWVPTGNHGVTVQGPMPGNANAVWVVPTGNPGSVGQGFQPATGNPGWAPPTGNMGATVQQMVPGNANPGWIPPTGNPGASIHRPAPGHVNPGWGGAPANKGAWGSGQHQNGEGLSNQGDRGSYRGDSSFNGGRPWNRQSLFGHEGPYVPKGQRACPFFQMGHCKKGSRCDYMHN